ncbi:hypothetical protein ACTJKO_00100 [Curtobacterium sp. 22159]|uniref:hypothetical protein n=1 Tax=Curtobacterium sp. 22159 TaxID=3453882 RepID=UPI003F82E8AD
MRATPEPGEPGADSPVVAGADGPVAAGDDDASAAGADRVPDDLSDLDPEDAFGHRALADPTRDDDVWPDGDEDDIDV